MTAEKDGPDIDVADGGEPTSTATDRRRTRMVLGQFLRLAARGHDVQVVVERPVGHAVADEPRQRLQQVRPLGPLHGVPFSVKDLVITKGVRTTFGTRLFADNVPTEVVPAT